MNYKGNVFGRTVKRELSRAGEGFLSALVRAVFCAALTLGICLLLPAGTAPAFWQEKLSGSAYVYALVSCAFTMLWRLFNSRIFSYGDSRKGRWAFAASCGASVKKAAFAKWFAALHATVFSYVLGAAVVLGVRIALGGDTAQLLPALQMLGVGLLTLLVHSCILMLLGAMGMRSKLLGGLSVLFSALLMAAWLLFGMFSFTAAGEKVDAAAVALLAIPVGLPLVAAVLVLLSLLLCLTAPVKRAARYAVEELDDEMLQQLQFPRELEVYQKDGNEYELVFSGADVAEK